MNQEEKRHLFHLVPNWKRVARRAWSVWLILLAGLFSGLEAALPHLPAVFQFQRGDYALASLVVSGLAWIARLLAQNELHEAKPEQDGEAPQ